MRTLAVAGFEGDTGVLVIALCLSCCGVVVAAASLVVGGLLVCSDSTRLRVLGAWLILATLGATVLCWNARSIVRHHHAKSIKSPGRTL